MDIRYVNGVFLPTVPATSNVQKVVSIRQKCFKQTRELFVAFCCENDGVSFEEPSTIEKFARKLSSNTVVKTKASEDQQFLT